MFLAMAAGLGLAGQIALAAPPVAPTNAPARIELTDQFDTPQVLAFPSSNVVALTIADKKGSAQIDGWIAPLKSRYAGRIEIRGLADVGGVPVFLRGRVRKSFQESRRHPVMLDWSGKVCAQFGYVESQANLLVLRPDGRIIGRFSGEPTSDLLASLFALIEDELRHSSGRSTTVSTVSP